jgi:hypothetical protein
MLGKGISRPILRVAGIPLIAVGEVWWEDAREPGGSGHLFAIGVVEVPDGTAVSLSVYTVAEVSVSDQQAGIFEARCSGSPLRQATPVRCLSAVRRAPMPRGTPPIRPGYATS